MNMSGNELPQYATELAAGMDVRAANDEPIVLKPLQRALVPTGLFVEIPAGHEIQVRPRSGLAAKNADYRGEIRVILVNLSSDDFVIERGERIAQLVLARHERMEWEESGSLEESARGAGGFGSTGVK